MIAKSLDVVVLLKLLLNQGGKSYAQLSKELGISASEIHAAVRRGIAAGLVQAESKAPIRRALTEYLISGVRYAFPAAHGPVARGMPTAYAAPPMAQWVVSEDLPPVWPEPEGLVKGFAVEPLYNSVPGAAKLDTALYELLTLVDAIRIGRARERKLAEDELRKRIDHAHTA
jgi:DNA-binding Lrp family transcriptional regulator